jgi:hypothetical protein
MSIEDIAEQALRMELMKMRIDKAQFDMEAERRRYRRENWIIGVAAAGLALAAFLAGRWLI